MQIEEFFIRSVVMLFIFLYKCIQVISDCLNEHHELI